MIALAGTEAVVSRAGARTGLQFQGHGDMQWFDSTSAAFVGFSVTDKPRRLAVVTYSVTS